MSPNLDAHARPPQALRDMYKGLQKTPPKDTESHPQVTSCNGSDLQFVARIERSLMVGLYIYPSLLPPSVQLQLLDKLVHRDLSNPKHQTNVHLHHSVPHPPSDSSYFSPTSSDFQFEPKHPNTHKPFAIDQFMNKKLRWMTLGGQYDWTRKVYPAGKPPDFPQDVKELVEQAFPMKAEAAIVNFYSPGDQLSLHRDVSEECSEPLVSISLGCEAVFLCGIEEAGVAEEQDCQCLALHLRSGDAVLMSGQARYAWHGVPKVFENTCPEWMADWPYACHGSYEDKSSAEFERWRGWMKGKRVNLNVRQMFTDV
ncbi:hypothetical protein K431DRAFT_258953 [Polychaeton citri CBS 116435]|uniref:mRNA N(6)-methyladenine demethylase n=1 Tax=Polychaeton citri CBS 116435 TaxID=1314669 RepID=A0A9P4QII6_9PEZI|nr:hypothetical protein K431DRAFT_258953 [Polychaeton citri CBS 116435]